MKSKILGIMLIALGMVLPGCEVDMPLQKEGVLGYALNSIINTDTTVIAYVSNYYSVGNIIDERIQMGDEGLYDFICGGMLSSSSKPTEYKSKGYVDNAKISYYVNGEYMGLMEFKGADDGYYSDYKPKVGDKITIKATTPLDKTFEVEGSATLPAPSNFEIVDVEKMYMAKDGFVWERRALSDTVIKVTVRLHDPAGEKNYYRLKVRSKIADFLEPCVNDVFWSDDPLFYDENLWMNMANWPTGTTPFFDDSGFDGKDREFTVFHRPVMRTGFYQLSVYECFVDVQSITADVFLHQKSLITYMQSGESTYGEPTYIHSNTSTGFGLVGGITSNKHHIESFISVEDRYKTSE